MLPTITVDVGTTSVKFCHFDESGELLGSDRCPTPTTTDATGEVYALDLLSGAVARFIQSVEPVERADVRRVAITGVGESGGLVRADLSLASPMILWHDHRGATYLSQLSDADRALIYRTTGLPVNANYGLSKVAWAVAHSDGSSDGAQWLNIAEYLAASMSGERWSEYSLASRTMALDLRSRAWSPEVSALVGLDVGIFPELRTAHEGAQISRDYARSVGLSDDVRVHVAGHDHMVGAVGADLGHGELLNSTGTTEGLLFLRDEPSLDEASAMSKLANGVSPTGAEYTLFASIPTGGSAFATLQSMLSISAADLSRSISEVHERYIQGDVELTATPLVLPQFRGSPPPTKSASARGIIAGLRSNTTTRDLVFGFFLGMALQFRDVLDLFPTRPERIKVIGPASRNALWLQLKADVLGTPLSVSGFAEVVSQGAQALASGGSREWSSCQPTDVIVDAGRSALLDEWHAQTRDQWEYLKGLPS